MLINILLVILVLVGIIEFYGWVEKYPSITIVEKHNRNVFLTTDYARTTTDIGNKDIAKWNVLDFRRFFVLWKMGVYNWSFRKVSYPKTRVSASVDVNTKKWK